MALSRNRSFSMFTNHLAEVSSRCYATLKYYDLQLKRFYRFFVYNCFIIVVCEQNHEIATIAPFTYWGSLCIALDGQRSRSGKCQF